MNEHLRVEVKHQGIRYGTGPHVLLPISLREYLERIVPDMGRNGGVDSIVLDFEGVNIPQPDASMDIAIREKYGLPPISYNRPLPPEQLVQVALATQYLERKNVGYELLNLHQ